MNLGRLHGLQRWVELAMDAVVCVVAGEGLAVYHKIALRAAVCWIAHESGKLLASWNLKVLEGYQAS